MFAFTAKYASTRSTKKKTFKNAANLKQSNTILNFAPRHWCNAAKHYGVKIGSLKFDITHKGWRVYRFHHSAVFFQTFCCRILYVSYSCLLSIFNDC